MYHCPECGCIVIAAFTHPPCDIDNGCPYGVEIDYSGLGDG